MSKMYKILYRKLWLFYLKIWFDCILDCCTTGKESIIPDSSTRLQHIFIEIFTSKVKGSLIKNIPTTDSRDISVLVSTDGP